jgi:hypothetical protein
MRRRPLAARVLALGCGTARPAHQPPPRASLDADGIAALIDPHVKDRAAWGQAVLAALEANHVPLERPSACGVLAVIGQESGFQQDPAVPGLARLVEARLESYREKLGPLGQPVFARLLAGHGPHDPRPFDERLRRVHTERDLDLVFRDLLAHYQDDHPAAYEAATLAGKLFDLESLGDLNPITTAGPMQVSVRFAGTWAREHGHDPEVRDALYTRAGGVMYGTARLFGTASYPRMLFRFADYNAGLYASRNAAVQAQVAKLVGTKLALDGDLLRYQKDGRPSDDDSQTLAALRAFRERFAPALPEERLRADAELEKTRAFEETATYHAVKATYATRVGPPEYAIVPVVVLEGPKLSRKLTTAWYAESVNKRFEACLAR